MAYVLLVEDNQDNADIMIRLLRSLNLEVRHTKRGLEGAGWARREPPILILMDINLPDIDGRTIILMLKKQLGGKAAPPIVAVTARKGENEMWLAERFGCSAFISKPFEPEAFLSVIRELLPKWTDSAATEAKNSGK